MTLSVCQVTKMRVLYLAVFVRIDDKCKQYTNWILSSMARASLNVSIIVQQGETTYSLFISAKCSTCFVWYFHPSSGDYITVSTVSGITETGSYLSWSWRSLQVAVMVSIMPDTVDTVIWAPGDGWRYHTKHVEQFADINKLYVVAFSWTTSDTIWTA